MRDAPNQGIFQSTLPARGATIYHHDNEDDEDISIHAPREGSDKFKGWDLCTLMNFNPRSPRGERLPGSGKTMFAVNFNPRSPRGERLLIDLVAMIFATFQSTLPARGATSNTAPRSTMPGDFNPRSPRGERRVYRGNVGAASDFNPRSPRGERPAQFHAFSQSYTDFNPRSPRGERRKAGD